nr:hypothetical protein [Tanacetum cinerariifolium]
MNSCGALCTYSLYDKQVNGAGAWANGTVHQAIFSLHSLNRNRATLQIGLITSHLTVIALLIPYWIFVTSGLSSLEPFPSARSPNEEGVSGLWSRMLIPLFVLLLLLGQEEDKKRPSVLLVFQPVASKDCPLSVGCWSSLLRGSPKRYAWARGREKKRLRRKKLGFPILVHAQRDAPTSGCFTPNPTRHLIRTLHNDPNTLSHLFDTNTVTIIAISSGTYWPTTSLSLRPGPSQWGDPVGLLPPQKKETGQAEPLLPDGNFPHIAINIRLPVDISSNSSIREANCCMEESISRHKPRGRSCATPPGQKWQHKVTTSIESLSPLESFAGTKAYRSRNHFGLLGGAFVEATPRKSKKKVGCLWGKATQPRIGGGLALDPPCLQKRMDQKGAGCSISRSGGRTFFPSAYSPFTRFSKQRRKGGQQVPRALYPTHLSRSKCSLPILPNAPICRQRLYKCVVMLRMLRHRIDRPSSRSFLVHSLYISNTQGRMRWEGRSPSLCPVDHSAGFSHSRPRLTAARGCSCRYVSLSGSLAPLVISFYDMLLSSPYSICHLVISASLRARSLFFQEFMHFPLLHRAFFNRPTTLRACGVFARRSLPVVPSSPLAVWAGCRSLLRSGIASGIGADSASADLCRTGVIQYVVSHVPPLLRSFPIQIVKHLEQQDVDVRN